MSNATAALPTPPSPTAGATYRRHIKYVDSAVQRPLMAALIALEVLLVIAATLLAYWHLNNQVDESLYRVHITHTGPVWRKLLGQGFWLLGVFAAINLLALAVADALWSRRENAVIADFGAIIAKTQVLDFSADNTTGDHHAVIDLAHNWRNHERKRFTAVREQVAKLEALAASGGSTQEAQQALDSLKHLLS